MCADPDIFSLETSSKTACCSNKGKLDTKRTQFWSHCNRWQTPTVFSNQLDWVQNADIRYTMKEWLSGIYYAVDMPPNWKFHIGKKKNHIVLLAWIGWKWCNRSIMIYNKFMSYAGKPFSRDMCGKWRIPVANRIYFKATRQTSNTYYSIHDLC